MMRPSWLDSMVERFQHNWETNPQYRAVVSGVAGLVAIVGLCAVMGVAFSFANAVGGSIGGVNQNNNGSFVNSSGPSSQPTQITFPMLTLTPWPDSSAPNAAPLPASGTPQPTVTPVPTATLAPTPTPCKSNCGGGPADNITVSISPSPFDTVNPITVYVQTTYPNDQFAISVTWPTGGYVPQGYSGTTDGSGAGSVSIGTVPSGSTCPGGRLTLWVVTQYNVTGVRTTFRC